MNKNSRFFLLNDTKKSVSLNNDGVGLARRLKQRHRFSLFLLSELSHEQLLSVLDVNATSRIAARNAIEGIGLTVCLF